MIVFLECLVLFLIIIVGLLLRYIPHYKYEFPETPDTFFFFNKLRDPDYETHLVIYPTLFFQMFRVILRNKKEIQLKKINRITPLIDLLSLVIFYLALRPTFGANISLPASLAFFVAPFVVKQGVALSARPFGLLLVNASLLGITLPSPYNWLASIPIALTLLSHRLSTQVLFVTLPALSLFDLQIGFILVLGFTFAVLFSKGGYLTVLMNHIITVKNHITGSHYANERILGLILLPSVTGFGMFCSLLILQQWIIYPITIFGFVIEGTSFLNPYFETVLIIWGMCCLLLLVIWIAGEAYKHTYLAAIPFAFFSARILESSILFQVVYLLIIISSVCLSLYFVLRFEHLDPDYMEILSQLANRQDAMSILVPSGLGRAAEFFSKKKSTHVYFEVLTEEVLSLQIQNEGATHAIIQKHQYKWFENWQVISEQGNWLMLKK